MTLLTHSQIQHKLSDFMLDLLSAEEKEVVQRHILECQECRLALRRERQIGRMVYRTLNTAARPTMPQLQRLMPSAPTKRSSVLQAFSPYRQWAVACLFIVAMMGAFIFGSSTGYNGIVRQAETHPATLSSLNGSVVISPQTTRPAEALWATAVQSEGVPSQSAPLNMESPPIVANPIAPQVTPAPAATYYQ